MQLLEESKGDSRHVQEHDKVDAFDRLCPEHMGNWGMLQRGITLVHRFAKAAPGVDVLEGGWVTVLLHGVCGRVYEALEDDLDFVFSLRQAELSSAVQMVCRDKLELCFTQETLPQHEAGEL
jgi:hypothetical protein